MAHIAELVGLHLGRGARAPPASTRCSSCARVGRYCVNVCTNISCQLLGGEELLDHAEETLGVRSRRHHRGRHVHPRGRRVRRRLHRGSGGAGQLPLLPPPRREDFDQLIEDLRSGGLDDGAAARHPRQGPPGPGRRPDRQHHRARGPGRAGVDRAAPSRRGEPRSGEQGAVRHERHHHTAHRPPMASRRSSRRASTSRRPHAGGLPRQRFLRRLRVAARRVWTCAPPRWARSSRRRRCWVAAAPGSPPGSSGASARPVCGPATSWSTATSPNPAPTRTACSWSATRTS